MPGQQLKRVLVVDDNSDVRDLLGAVLRKRGLTVDLAVDGREALDLIQQNRYSVVLLDLIMPGVDGFNVLARLSDPAMSAPVVLVVTGADREAIDKLDPHRIHGIVKKPFDPEELAALVVACAEIKARNPFETMAIATMIAGGPIWALLNRLGS